MSSHVPAGLRGVAGSSQPGILMLILRLLFAWATALLLLGAALFLALGAAGAQLGRWSGRYDLLTHLAPVWATGGVLVLGLGLLTGRSWAKVAVCIAGLIAATSGLDLLS